MLEVFKFDSAQRSRPNSGVILLTGKFDKCTVRDIKFVLFLICEVKTVIQIHYEF